MRDQTACQMRVKNEAEWLPRSLPRTFEVCQRVVILDDGSTDATEAVALASLGVEATITHKKWGWIGYSADGQKELHFLPSPFTEAVRPIMKVSEIRDRQLLWEYCKSCVPFTIMLCLDGDESLTRRAIRNWPQLIEAFRAGYQIAHLGFIYVWDREDQRRVDALYGDQENGIPKLNFPRCFSIAHVADDHLHTMRFAWGGTKGGYHCGSLPREKFRVNGDHEPKAINTIDLPVLHWGYLRDEERRRKVAWYRSVDPDNKFEGNYNHCLGEPDLHCPGPMQFTHYEDV